MKTSSPIKRNKSLVLLSRDHHDGLLLVWKIRQGIKLDVDRARIGTYTVNLFDKELEPHFKEEEDLLFKQLHPTDELRVKAENQHAELRNKIAAFRLSSPYSDAALLSFASLLEDHIRFEERILFPHLEKSLSTETLEEIGKQLEADHASKECLTWTDEFWKKDE